MTVNKREKITAWFRLFRPPNLFTVPGDAAAGFFLASLGNFSWLLVGAGFSALLLYSAGLLLNDYYDRDEDARERSFRPIPSGAVRAGSVMTVGLVLILAGVLVAFITRGLFPAGVAVLVGIFIWVYDSGLGKNKYLGPVFMGLCRAGSLFLGAAVAGTACYLANWALWTAVATAFIYTALITYLAADETSGKAPGLKAYLPGIVLVIAMLAAIVIAPTAAKNNILMVLVFGLAGVEALKAASLVNRGHVPVPAFIGRLIRVMITVQAAWIIWYPFGREFWELLLAVFIMALFRIGAEMSARRFYGS